MADDIKETPSPQQQQEQERSIFVDSKQSAKIVFSTPIQEHAENTATIYRVSKKVAFSCDSDQLQTYNNLTQAKKELSSCFVSGVKENQEKFDFAREMITSCDSVSGVLKCERKVKDFGVQVEETKHNEGGCVANVEKNLNDAEKTQVCGLVRKEREIFLKVEVGSSGTQECGKFKEEKDSIIEGDSQENMHTSSVDVGKEMSSETLLEAEKKRLLAELELGTAFEDKTHVDKVTGIGSDCEGVQNDGATIDGIKLIDGSVRRSVKVEVIDDTALIESVQVPKTGNGCLKGVEIEGTGKMMKRNGKEKKHEMDGKKSKRPRRKAKENLMEVSASLNNLTHMVEDQAGELNNGGQVKNKYSRKEMEALRFVNIVEQRKMWRDIYTGLGNVVVIEYDNLANSKHRKQNFVYFDPKLCFSRKSEAPGILGQECSENKENEAGFTQDYVAENLNTMNAAYCSHNIEEVEAYAIPEGECSEDYDSDEDYASIQKPAFLVEGEPDFDSGPPEDGLEYLRRVRWEAAHIPKVKVAKPGRQKCMKEQTVYMPQVPVIAKCLEHLLPLKQWEDLFLADFSDLRLAVSGLGNSSAQFSGELQQQQVINRSSENIIMEKFNNLNPDEGDSYHPLDDISLKSSTDQLSVPTNEDDEISLADQSPKTCPGNDSGDNPTLSAILRIDFVARASMLRKRINSVETLSTLSRNDCLWLFALCTAVDTPLDADTCAAVRSLLRKCASLRARKSEVDDEVIMLNILATISGKYFGQSEH